MRPVALAMLIALTPAARAAVPLIPIPAENPLTPERAMLGKFLFWDEQLSSDNTVACGTCHEPGFGGKDPRRAVNPGADGLRPSPDDIFGSFGVITMGADALYTGDAVFGDGPQITGRAAQTVLGALWSPLAFWDGRAGASFADPVSGAVLIPFGGALEAQAVGPILNTTEMGHAGRTWDDVTTKLAGAPPLGLSPSLPAAMEAARAAAPSYPALFALAFGDDQITAARIGFAIAAYERTLVADQTPYDRFEAGDPAALTAQQARGLNTFLRTPCAVCHAPPLFTDSSFRNIGLRPIAEDAGRGDITGQPADDGRFKVPSLRGVGLETAFMHNGAFTSLEQVLDFYVAPPRQFPQNQDPLVPQIRLAPPERADIIAFLRGGLTDDRLAAGLAPFDAPALHASVGACSDGVDNDSDGLGDLVDPGCFSDADTSELAHELRCDDGLDNDGDGSLDGADPNCDLAAFSLAVSALSPGFPATFHVDGAAPGARVTWFVSTRGQGMGPCHPTAPICLDLLAPSAIGSAVADASGAADLTVTVPAGARAGLTLWAQAAWFAGGGGEVSAVATEIVE